MINSFILTFNYFLIIILFLLFLLIIKFESIKPILKKKYFIYFFLSVIITVAIYNLGGYPISFSGLNGRVFLIPALYFVLIVYFILNFLNSKKRKNLKFLLYVFILFGYLNSSYYFYELSKNQEKSFDKINNFVNSNKGTKNIFLFTDLKTSFYEINLSSYINQLYNLNLENVYLSGWKHRL